MEQDRGRRRRRGRAAHLNLGLLAARALKVALANALGDELPELAALPLALVVDGRDCHLCAKPVSLCGAASAKRMKADGTHIDSPVRI